MDPVNFRIWLFVIVLRRNIGTATEGVENAGK